MERNSFRSVTTGGVIVLIGIVYLLFNLGILPPEWKDIVMSWQGLLVLLGVIGICKGNFVGGTILAGIGVCFLLPNLSTVLGFFYSTATLHSIMWPAIIILIGLLIMSHRHHHHHDFKGCHRTRYSNESKDGKVDYNLVMNGIDDVFLDPVFRGGVTLLLPLDWKVVLHNDSILGGFADHRRCQEVAADRRLIINASFILGGGSIE